MISSTILVTAVNLKAFFTKAAYNLKGQSATLLAVLGDCKAVQAWTMMIANNWVTRWSSKLWPAHRDLFLPCSSGERLSVLWALALWLNVQSGFQDA